MLNEKLKNLADAIRDADVITPEHQHMIANVLDDASEQVASMMGIGNAEKADNVIPLRRPKNDNTRPDGVA